MQLVPQLAYGFYGVASPVICVMPTVARDMRGRFVELRQPIIGDLKPLCHYAEINELRAAHELRGLETRRTSTYRRRPITWTRPAPAPGLDSPDILNASRTWERPPLEIDVAVKLACS